VVVCGHPRLLPNRQFKEATRNGEIEESAGQAEREIESEKTSRMAEDWRFWSEVGP